VEAGKAKAEEGFLAEGRLGMTASGRGQGQRPRPRHVKNPKRNHGAWGTQNHKHGKNEEGFLAEGRLGMTEGGRAGDSGTSRGDLRVG
jgi:hypothetical protein